MAQVINFPNKTTTHPMSPEWAARINARKKSFEVLDAGLDLMVTLLTGDDYDLLEEAQAIRARLNSKNVPAKSLVFARDILKIASDEINPENYGGAA